MYSFKTLFVIQNHAMDLLHQQNLINYSNDSADSSSSSLIQMHNWKLREDRKGKPGWITHNSATSGEASISFPMQFGEHPRLIVSYLKSYKGLGKVNMTLNNRTIILSGLYTSQEQPYNVSQTAVLALEVWRPDPFVGFWNFPFGFNVPKHSNLTVTFSSDSKLNTNGASKFKIVSVSSC
mmetsp:Transcript_3103/g.4726  ORF Transcript_3103/g.4726 Transcript_3103/m.4726 type:complete len:180 (+) Transcript_3103:789-1328(+)